MSVLNSKLVLFLKHYNTAAKVVLILVWSYLWVGMRVRFHCVPTEVCSTVASYSHAISGGYISVDDTPPM